MMKTLDISTSGIAVRSLPSTTTAAPRCLAMRASGIMSLSLVARTKTSGATVQRRSTPSATITVSARLLPSRGLPSGRITGANTGSMPAL